MKTMGLTRLVLVAPRRMPDDESRALAAGAIDVLENARYCDSLREALDDAALAFAFSARPRQLSHLPLDVRAAAAQAVQSAQDEEVALVFGNETAGLENSDVLLCNRLVHIPTAGHASLNLAAAVQVAAYEVRRAAVGGEASPRGSVPADVEEVERFYDHLERSLRLTGFLDPGKPKRLMERLRRLFARSQLEREEVNILRGMLSAFEEHAQRTRKVD